MARALLRVVYHSNSGCLLSQQTRRHWTAVESKNQKRRGEMRERESFAWESSKKGPRLARVSCARAGKRDGKSVVQKWHLPVARCLCRSRSITRLVGIFRRSRPWLGRVCLRVSCLLSVYLLAVHLLAGLEVASSWTVFTLRNPRLENHERVALGQVTVEDLW